MSKRTTLPLAAFAVLTVALALPAAAHPRQPYSMEVLVDGAPLDALHARGKTYVEAVEGREYSIRLTNRTARRVAVALAVDGLNSIDAKSGSARSAAKWILAPWQTVTIDGWQTGPSTARRFFFTTEEDSYGAWLGKTQNLGVISAAFFRERLPEPRPAPYQDGDELRAPSKSGGADAPSAPGERRERSQRKSEAESEGLSDDHAATGMGREVGHRVQRVHFDAEPAPAAVVELRYEYRDSLVSLGVLPPEIRPLDRRERAHGFDDVEYAPVQPRWHRR